MFFHFRKFVLENIYMKVQLKYMNFGYVFMATIHITFEIFKFRRVHDFNRNMIKKMSKTGISKM